MLKVNAAAPALKVFLKENFLFSVFPEMKLQLKEIIPPQHSRK